MEMNDYTSPYLQAKLSIQKALQFVGDNSTYQKKRLAILSIIILSTGILNCKIPLQGRSIATVYLIASGAGQIVCPIYMSLRTCTFGLSAFTLLAMASYPFSVFFTNVSLLGLGFFGRGFFVGSLIYINEIGGDRFRAWSMIVIFGMWGISSLVLSIQKIAQFPTWVSYYFLIYLPFLIGSYLVLLFWQPSPFKLYVKRNYKQTTQVLNRMAIENDRPMIPYGLQGEEQQNTQYKKINYWNFINRPLIRKITIPLLVVWVYRQFVYYGSYMIIPLMGGDYSKSYILFSISQIIAILLSYPIKLSIKRTNAFFFSTIIVAFFALLSSFTVLTPECMMKTNKCSAKYIYQVSIFMIRFASALIGNILVTYTLQIYPSNVRSMGFSLCIGVSSLGSIFVPWINELFIYANLSGFITFSVASIVVFYFINQLNETYGRICVQSIEQLQKNSCQVALTNWATLNF